MLQQDDLKWIAKTSTELNTVLQQIARYADLAKRRKGDHDYIEQLNRQVEIASQSAQALFNRVTSKAARSGAEYRGRLGHPPRKSRSRGCDRDPESSGDVAGRR